MLLSGKNVIITGCNRGIGYSMLKCFASNGANIYACARKSTIEFEATVAEIANENGVEIWPVYFDLSDENQIKAAVKKIQMDRRPIHALVNNAGITYNALFQMSSVEKLKETFIINFFSMFLFTQYISKLMVRQKYGSIVNIASTAGIDGNAGKSVYGASKAAVICMTKSIAEELGEHGVRANSIAPGITQTDMLSSMSEDVINESIIGSDLKRAGNPVEIANAAVYLASDLSSYVTGQVIRVDGGLR